MIAAPLLLLMFNGCGGRAINKKTAQELIAGSPLASLNKENVYVESVSQTGSRDAIVEARLKAAFRFEKVGDKWVIREVRFGDRPWEKVEAVLRALQVIKTEDTRKLLRQVAEAMDAYCLKNGKLPEFKDYVGLSDKLYPEYMNPLIRLDAWERPLSARRIGPDSVRLASAGPDGIAGSADDIDLVHTIRH